LCGGGGSRAFLFNERECHIEAENSAVVLPLVECDNARLHLVHRTLGRVVLYRNSGVGGDLGCEFESHQVL
jgi:hypothetical protein